MKKRIIFIGRNFEEISLTILMIITLVVVLYQVLLRYIFNDSLSWADEFARYALIWMAWIGVSLTVKKREHLRIDLIHSFLSKKRQRMLEIVVIVICLIIPILFIFKGMSLVNLIYSTNQIAQTMPINMWIIYLIIPFSGMLISIRLLQYLIIIWKEKE